MLRFQELAVENGIENPEVYSTQNMKKQLINKWEEVSFVSHPGLPDLICSKEITISDALRKAHAFSKDLEDHEASRSRQDLTHLNESQWSEEIIIHAAVGILRDKLKGTKNLDKEYFSSAEMSLDAALEFVDPLLLKVVGWLGDADLYKTAGDIKKTESAWKYISIACDITTLNTKVMSPKHLGLSVHLYHEHGSRKLIEDVHDLGYGISYTELRQFLTSAAIHTATNSKSLPAGALVPPELLSKQEGGGQVVAAGDNWDHNELSPDGLCTTHAMTSILVSQNEEDGSCFRIPRSASGTYDIKALPGTVLIISSLLVLTVYIDI